MTRAGRAAGPGPQVRPAPAAVGRAAAANRTRTWLALICLGALALRVAHVLAMRASPLFDHPTMDALYHVEWARAFAAGRSYTDGPFFRAPLYPWFLGAIFKLFGDGLLLPRLVQCALGSAATALTFLAARRAFDAQVGLVAAFLVATNWVLVHFDGELLLPTLIVPLDVLALWLTLRIPTGSVVDEVRTGDAATPDPAAGAPRRALAAGLAWGLTCIARPNPLIFVPFLALWLGVALRARARTALAAVGALAVGVAAPILPITAYNAAQGDTVLIASQAGVNFWIGNNPHSDGSTAIVPGTRGGWWEGFEDSRALAESAMGRELRPSEVSRYWFQRTFAWFREAPGAALELFRWKLRLLITDWELGNNQDVRFFAQRFGIASCLPPGFGLFGGFGVLLGLATVGLALGARRRSRHFPLWAFLVVYALGIAAFFVNSRYRTPLLPVLAIYAALALVWLARAVRARRFGALAVLVPAALVAGFSMRVPAAVETSPANGLLQLSIAEKQRAAPERALEHARAAVAADPNNRMALRQLGVLLVAAGRAVEAVAPLREAVQLADSDADSLLALSEALRHAGEPGQAQSWAARAATLAPHLARAHAELGRVHFAQQRYDAAVESFAVALERDPRSFDAAYSLALSLEGAGRAGEAFEAWRRAVELAAHGERDFVRRAFDATARGWRARGREDEAARLERERP